MKNNNNQYHCAKCNRPVAAASSSSSSQERRTGQIWFNLFGPSEEEKKRDAYLTDIARGKAFMIELVTSWRQLRVVVSATDTTTTTTTTTMMSVISNPADYSYAGGYDADKEKAFLDLLNDRAGQINSLWEKEDYHSGTVYKGYTFTEKIWGPVLQEMVSDTGRSVRMEIFEKFSTWLRENLLKRGSGEKEWREWKEKIFTMAVKAHNFLLAKAYLREPSGERASRTNEILGDAYQGQFAEVISRLEVDQIDIKDCRKVLNEMFFDKALRGGGAGVPPPEMMMSYMNVMFAACSYVLVPDGVDKKALLPIVFLEQAEFIPDSRSFILYTSRHFVNVSWDKHTKGYHIAEKIDKRLTAQIVWLIIKKNPSILKDVETRTGYAKFQDEAYDAYFWRSTGGGRNFVPHQHKEDEFHGNNQAQYDTLGISEWALHFAAKGGVEGD